MKKGRIHGKDHVNFLFELLAEEIPSRLMEGILQDLQSKFAAAMESAQVEFSGITAFGTSRRLVLWVTDLPKKQLDRKIIKKGPPVEMAYSPDGIPSMPAIGFAKTAGVDVKKLVRRKEGNREYVFAEIVQKGRPVKNLLSEVVPEVLRDLELPISMRWGDGEHRFIRPVHAIVALCGGEVVPFTFAGMKSGNRTMPHRMLTQKPIVFSRGSKISMVLYQKRLAKAGVIISPKDRRQQMKKEAERLGKKFSALPDWTDWLLEELCFILENPAAGVAEMKESYLELPKPVLESVLRKQQKYVPLINKDGELISRFIYWTDRRRKNISVVQEGNERVVDARLADAKFFFEEDKKTSLLDRKALLKHVSFLGNLGSMADKVSRVEQLSLWLAELWDLPASDKDVIQRVASLSKSDLTTELVKEFPDLQGILGAEYARLFGEKEEVALGIMEHVRPLGADDLLPSKLPGVVVSVADKLDTLVGGFGIGLTPTGSEDPYGFRRLAAAIINILLDKFLLLSISKAVALAHGFYGGVAGVGLPKNHDVLSKEIWEFLQVRLRGKLMEEGIRYDVVDAAMKGSDDPSRVRKLARVMMDVVDVDWMRGVIQTADRVARLAKNAKHANVLTSAFVESDEKTLYTLFLDVSERVQGELRRGAFDAVLKELGRFTNPVAKYFERVMVMHEDSALRENRLAMLKKIDQLFKSVADFPQVVLQKEGSVEVHAA